MSLVSDVVPNLHLEGRREELAIAYGSGCIPDLDDVKLTLRREGDAYDDVVVGLEHCVGEAVDHAVDKHCVGLVSVDLLGPCATLVVFGGVPQRTKPLAHQEEHARIPRFGRDCLHHRPEFGRRVALHDLDVACERVVCIVGVVIPQDPGMREGGGRGGVGHCNCRRARLSHCPFPHTF
jgi:hypothetical protein